MFMRPTDDSGLDCVLAEKIRLTASAWASHREGLNRHKPEIALLRFTGGGLHIVAISAALTIVHPGGRSISVSFGGTEESLFGAYTIIVASSTISMGLE